MAERAKIAVQNINVPNRESNVDAEKYEAMKLALLSSLPRSGVGVTQTEMVERVLPVLPPHLWPGGAKAMWWVKTVQLDLEAKGLMRRDSSQKPTRWVVTD